MATKDPRHSLFSKLSIEHSKTNVVRQRAERAYPSVSGKHVLGLQKRESRLHKLLTKLAVRARRIDNKKRGY